jgi:hypothetical protein
VACAGYSRACGTHGLALTARRSHVVVRGAARGVAAVHNVPCMRHPSSMAGSHSWSSHGDGGLGGMSGPRAPHGRGAAVLRLEGQQTGKVTRRRTPTPPVQHIAETKEGKR